MASNIGRERKPITVLFADIVDSTAMAEGMDPEDWAATMNGAFDLMAQAVQRYEGTVAQFLGDGILAFFGAPVAHEDDPQRAVWAALHMLDATAKFGSVPGPTGEPGLRIRIGINTGPVILGRVGNLESGTYSAMGDTLNTAARVQSAAAPSSVAVTDNTYRLVATTFEGEDLGEITVKGKAAPVHCHRITGPRTADQSMTSAGLLDTPIIGRESQLNRLRRLTSALEKGRGGAAFVIGEPGIGKSRLIREVRSPSSSVDPELLWLEGRALSYGSSVPYGLVVQVVRSIFGTGLATDPEEASAIVAQVLEELVGPGATASFPYIAHLLSVPVAGAALPEGIAPEALQQGYVDSLTLVLSAAAARRPIVILCEDLHWADASSTALLSKLLRIAGHSRVLFLASTRREPGSAGWRLLTEARDAFGEALTELNLDPFSPHKSTALCEQLLGKSMPPELSEFVFEVTEGNPLFIEEVLRTYVGSANSAEPDWSAVSKGSLLEGSPSLHSLMLSSIDRLPAEARRVLKVASVIGREFSVDLLAEVVEEIGEPLDVSRQLSSLEASGVARVSDVHPELQYSFRHALLQEAAYGSLLKSERKKLHAAVGTALEKVYPQRTGELAGLLARHFGEAGEDERTLAYSVVAADAAFTRYASSEAAAHYARAVEIATGSEQDEDRLIHLFLRLGRALELTDRYDEAIGAYRQLQELGRARDARGLELAGLVAGTTALVTPTGRQDIAGAERLARRALVLARLAGDRAAEGKSLWNLMLAYNFSGRDPAVAVEFGEAALEIARQEEGAEQIASTLLDLHWSYLGNGQMDRSFAALDEAIDLWQQIGDKVMLADSLSCASGLKLFKGDFQGVIADAEEARVLSEAAGSLWGQSFSRLYVGYALQELGHIDEAKHAMRECVRLAENSITVAGQVVTGADLGLLLVQTGSRDEGVAIAQRAWELSHQGSGAYRAWAASALARINVSLGKVDEAAAILQLIETDTGAGLFMPLPTRFPLGLARAEVALAQGDAGKCLSLSRSLADELARLHLKFWLPQALLMQARASRALGEIEHAVERSEKARSIAGEMGSSWSLRQIEAFLQDLGGLTSDRPG
jgi:class 3 adenylate cyclase/tetratricopeptide (TPR) repeat protein